MTHSPATHAHVPPAEPEVDVFSLPLLNPPFSPVDYGDTVDGLGSAIDTLDAVITPTEEALNDCFVENWTFTVIDGECWVRFMPMTERGAA